MVRNLLDSLLADLGEKIEIKDLKADRNNSCLIHFPEGLEIQLELDSSGDYLMFGTDFGSIQAGPYRENLFRQALRSNGLMEMHYGVFAFSQRTNHLVMQDQMRAKNINVHEMVDFFMHFKEKAALWKESIQKNEIPQIEGTTKRHVPSGMFGLAP